MKNNFLLDSKSLFEKLSSYIIAQGWSEESIRLASLEIYNDEFYIEACYGNLRDIVELYISYINDLLIETLDKDSNFPLARISDSVEHVIRLRLEIIGEDMVEKLYHFFISPSNVDLALCSICQTSDLIWKIVGDSSVDFSYYSKRLILSALYSSMILKFVHDKSIEKSESFLFLERRIQNIVSFSKVKHKVKASMRDACKKIPIVEFLLFD